MTQQISKIQLKRGLAVALAAVNPILLVGEPCLETDTGKIKFGNGTDPWNSLPYFAAGSEILDGDDTTIKVRRGTAAALNSSNPILSSGEPCLETDTGKIKYGDGTSHWNDLPYFSPGITEVDGGSHYPSTPPDPDNFTPASLSGLKVWLDADDDSSVYMMGDVVTQWGDKSGSESHAFQSLEERGPSRESNINGKKVITFDGASSAMVGRASLSDFTMFVLLRKNSNKADSVVVGMSDETSSSDCITPCSTADGTLFGAKISGSHICTQGVGTDPKVYSVTRNSQSGAVVTELDGANSASGSDSPKLTISYFSLGSSREYSSLFDGDIGEVVVYDRVLTSTEMGQVLGYFESKWLSAPPPPQGLLFQNLMAFWPMDELEFTRFDISPNSRNLSLNTDIAYDANVYSGAGVVGNCAEFPADTNTYLQCPANTLQIPTGSLSVSFWFKASGVTSENPLVGNWGGTDGGQFRVYVEEGSLKVEMKTSQGVSLPIIAEQTVQADAWTHVCAVYSSVDQILTIYLNNGQSMGPVEGSVLPTTNRLEVCSGEQGQIRAAYDTSIDCLGVWSRALNSSEVAYLYNDGDGTADLSGYTT